MFSNKINLLKVSEPFISPRYTRNFRTKAIFPETLVIYNCIFITKPLYVTERASQQEGKPCFLTSEMPEKISCLPKFKRHQTNAILVSLHRCSQNCYLSPQAGLEMRRKLRSTFSRSEVPHPHPILDLYWLLVPL